MHLTNPVHGLRSGGLQNSQLESVNREKVQKIPEELRCWRAEWLPNDCRRPESPAPDGLNL